MRKRMRTRTRVVRHNATGRSVRSSFRGAYGVALFNSDRDRLAIESSSSAFGRISVPDVGVYPEVDSGVSSPIKGFVVSEGVADNRRYNPSGASVGRRVLVTPQGHRSTSGQTVVPRGRRFEFLGFDVPSSVLVCVRRKQRRQVIFAKGKNGRGNKRPRWNATSHIWC